MMPRFLIIGAQRCGTASLYSYLTQHPSIGPAIIREVHFFDINFAWGKSWYRGHFPSVPVKWDTRQKQKHDLITGESSPYYLFHPLAPKRLCETLPDVKLIVLLRNPVDRAFSQYWHEIKRGTEYLLFEEAIASEPERLQGEYERLLADERYSSPAFQNHSYLARGIYVSQIKAWRRYFPESQMLILCSEDFYANPAATLKQAFGFLDVSNYEQHDYQPYNNLHYPAMNPDTRNRLLDYFRPHNEELYECLGRDFDWDK